MVYQIMLLQAGVVSLDVSRYWASTFATDRRGRLSSSSFAIAGYSFFSSSFSSLRSFASAAAFSSASLALIFVVYLETKSECINLTDFIFGCTSRKNLLYSSFSWSGEQFKISSF